MNWLLAGSISIGSRILWQQVQVLAHDPWVESSELPDLIWVGGDLGQQTYGFEVSDVAIYGFLGVSGLLGDLRSVETL